jgi:N-acetylglutamate synthase-like GNAT family acetyltransferase
VFDTPDLLAVYDRQLRSDAEVANAVAVTRIGSLHLATFASGRGFVTYPRLNEHEAAVVSSRIGEVLAHFRQCPKITFVEWKTRGHDQIPGLHQSLLDAGFERQEPESIMIGRAELLDAVVALPAGVTIRRVTEEVDVRTMAKVEDVVFGSEFVDEMVEELLRRLATDDELSLWVAEADGQVIGAGRLEPVAGTEFAGIWGGAMLESWRRRGIYRALTAARAKAALAAGKRFIYSDSTEHSRPILERSGLIKVSTTTPYFWRR